MEYEENNKRKEEGTTTCNFEIFQKMLGVEDFLEQDPYFEEVKKSNHVLGKLEKRKQNRN